MNDDVKAAVEWLRRLVRDGFSASGAHLLAHIDGEQARQNAAVAAAREDQREADARFIRSDEATWDSAHELDEVIRTSPLTATPLAGRIAELEREAKLLRHDADAEWGASATALSVARSRAEKAEAERDALRARVVEFERLQQVWLMSPEAAKRLDGYRELAEKCAALTDERDALRAQVEAARADVARIVQTGSMQALLAATEVLAAMDLAANGGKATLVTTTPGYSVTMKMP